MFNYLYRKLKNCLRRISGWLNIVASHCQVLSHLMQILTIQSIIMDQSEEAYDKKKRTLLWSNVIKPAHSKRLRFKI